MLIDHPLSIRQPQRERDPALLAHTPQRSAGLPATSSHQPQRAAVILPSLPRSRVFNRSVPAQGPWLPPATSMSVTEVSPRRDRHCEAAILDRSRLLATEHLVVICAGLAGLADVPWPAAALAGAAVFALQDLGALEPRSAQDAWRLTLGMALIGAGEACLAWGVGMCARLLAGS